MLMAMQLYGLYNENIIDVIIEGVHACTPLISIPIPGRVYCGLDDIHGLRHLVSKYNLRAAITHFKHDALLLSCSAVPGRLDVYENADDVPSSTLLHVAELDIGIRDIDRLKLFGLDTIGRLKSLSSAHLQAQYGSRGRRLFHFLHEGSDQALPMYVPPPSVVTMEHFDDAVDEPAQFIEALEQCLHRAIIELAQRHAWRVDVALVDRAGNTIHSRHRILRSGSNRKDQLVVHMHALIRKLTTKAVVCWGVRLRLASLRIPDSEQMSMFSTDTTFEDIITYMLPRYSHIIKRVTILNPWSVIPEEYAKISPWSNTSTYGDVDSGAPFR